MVLAEIGHQELARSMKNNIFSLAWGTVAQGDEWDVPPPVDLSAESLIAEVGRTKELVKEYVVQDENGAIEVGNQKWNISTTPTKYLYLKFVFSQSQNSGDDIYQAGLFINTVPVPGKENETYLLPSDVQEPGKMLFIENMRVIHRNDVTKEIFEYIITF